MSWKAEVFVTLKPSVQDPQGDTVRRALGQMGHRAVSGVRIGKYVELIFDGKLPRAKVEHQTDEICDKLLANPNIETYRFQIRKAETPKTQTARRKSGRRKRSLSVLKPPSKTRRR